MNKQRTEIQFAERMSQIPKSFIREILKVTSQPDVISFAGGLPNPGFFPVEAIKKATAKVLEKDPYSTLQYGVSEGFLPLREYLVKRYAEKGLKVSTEEIIITNGSQQALDLIGKVFINPGDQVLMERPSYLGAIQAFSAYQPDFISVDLLHEGVDTVQLDKILRTSKVKIFYTIPNFQNPSGISYSEDNRRIVSELVGNSNTILVEDDPYGEINFSNQSMTPIKSYLGNQSILLGSFSKMISPGLRLGWIVAEKRIQEKLLLAKQASDLHTNNLSQKIICQYLSDNDLEEHLKMIRKAYFLQKEKMLECIIKFFPKQVKYTNPKGGMFIWIELPDGLSSQDVLNKTLIEKIVFVPGEIFFTDSVKKNTFRLNFSNSREEEMEKGMKVIGDVLQELI